MEIKSEKIEKNLESFFKATTEYCFIIEYFSVSVKSYCFRPYVFSLNVS